MKKIVTIILLVFSISFVQAQEKDEKKNLKKEVYLKFKDGKKPIIYVDGKKFDFPMELIDQSQIESVFVVKGKEAIEKYKAADGVVLITTKGNKKDKDIYKEVSQKSKLFSSKTSPMVIIDGKVSDEATFKKLNTYEIESVEILKGEKAKKKYNAANGVVIIKTKKR